MTQAKETFFDRLDKFMAYSNLNDNKITVTAGLSIGILGKARKKSGGLSYDNIVKILYAYPNLNTDWLLLGKGEMLKREEYESMSVEVETNIDSVTDEKELFLSGEQFRLKSDANKKNRIFRYCSDKGENFEGWVACRVDFDGWQAYAYIEELRASFFVYSAFEESAFNHHVKGIVKYRELEFLD